MLTRTPGPVSLNIIFFKHPGCQGLSHQFSTGRNRLDSLLPEACNVALHLLNSLVSNTYNPLARRFSVNRATGKLEGWTNSAYWLDDYDEAVYWLEHFDLVVPAINYNGVGQNFMANPRAVLEKVRMHLYVPVFKDFLDYVGQNYQAVFDGGKIVFLGTGCKYLYQGMLKVASQYGIDPTKLFLLDLPQQKLGATITRDKPPILPEDRKNFLFRLLKSQGIVKDGDSAPIAFIDDQFQGRVVYLLEELLAERNIQAKGLGMLFCVGGQKLVRGFNEIFPDRQTEIRLASSLLDWHTRTRRPAEYIDDGATVTIRYENEPRVAFGEQMERLVARLLDELIRPDISGDLRPAWARIGNYPAPNPAVNAALFSQFVEGVPEAVMQTFGMNDFSRLKLTGRVFITGSGSSYNHALFLQNMLAKTGRLSQVLFPYDLAELDPIQSGDTLILISQGGRKGDAVHIAEYAKNKGARLVVFTASPDAPIAEKADEIYTFKPLQEMTPVRTQGVTAAYAALLDYVNALSGKVINYKIIYHHLLATLFNFDKQVQAVPGTYVFLAPHDLMPVAREGALKIAEAVQMPAKAMTYNEFVHGEHFYWRNDPNVVFVLLRSVENDPSVINTLLLTHLKDKTVINLSSSFSSYQALFVGLMQIILITRQLVAQSGADIYYPPGIEESSAFHRQGLLPQIIGSIPNAEVQESTASDYLSKTFASEPFARAWDGIETGSSIKTFSELLDPVLVDGARIVDIGPGTGKTMRQIAQTVVAKGLKDVEIIGIEQAADMLAVAEKTCQGFEGVNFRFVNGDAYELAQLLSELKGQVSAVIGRYSFQFIELPKLLPQIAEMLRPGGVLAFNMAAVNYYYDFKNRMFKPEFAQTNPFKAAFHEVIKEILEQELGRKITDLPIQQKVHLDPASLIPAMEEAGFQNVRLMPVSEQYSLRAKLQLAYLTDSLSFYWDVLRQFKERKHELINRVFEELARRFPEGRFTETDIFVSGVRNG